MKPLADNLLSLRDAHFKQKLPPIRLEDLAPDFDPRPDERWRLMLDVDFIPNGRIPLREERLNQILGNRFHEPDHHRSSQHRDLCMSNGILLFYGDAALTRHPRLNVFEGNHRVQSLPRRRNSRIQESRNSRI